MKKLILAASIAASFSAQAFSVSGYTGNVNNSVSSLLGEILSRRGYTATAQIAAETLAAAEVGVTASAAEIVAGGAAVSIAAITWPEVVAAIGVGAVAGTAICLAVDCSVMWTWGQNEQTMLGGTGMPKGDVHNFSVIPGSYQALMLAYPPTSDVWFAQDLTYAKGRHIKTIQVSCPTAGSAYCNGMLASTQSLDYQFLNVYSGPFPGTNGYWSNAYRETVVCNATACQYRILYDFVPPSGVVLVPPGYASVWQSPRQSVADIPESQRTVVLSDQQVAAIANAIAQAAAQAAAKAAAAGHPYGKTYDPVADGPVTPADVAAWRAKNPTKVPTVGDFGSPVAAPGDNKVPFPNTTTDSPTGTAVPGTQQVNVNIEWGDFTPPPAEAPSVPSILDPIFDLWPQWKNWSFPPHESRCPTPQFQAIGHTFTFDHMCMWVELIRTAVQASFALFWALSCIFIVMDA